MVTLTDWFDVSLELTYIRLLGLISYGLIVLGTIIFQIRISNKIRKTSVRSDSYLSFRLLYVAVAVIGVTYFSDHLGGFLGGSVMHSNFSIFLSVVGYTIAIYALNLFLLKIINFRMVIRRIIKVLAFIQVILLVLTSVVYLAASFTDKVPAELTDYSVIIFGSIVVLATVFTIISMFSEAKQTANKMVKLRLRLAAIGTIGILLEGMANIIQVILGMFDLAPEKYNSHIIPTLAVLFYAVFMFSYYYSLFPPMWLQRSSGILPPSFTDLMKKQEELKKLGRTIS
ncbi:MAG: hypothetical protein KAS22_04380 [Candidatus Heimdallarchaeota archaeon]|nr:hypothetical protein [Candidatus Heimdallarchaeota archaeon]